MKMMISCSEEETNNNNKNKKFCVDCKTTKTPLWRGGPAGPKSLCNACGIRCRKKRRAAQALKNAGSEKKPKNKGRSENGDGDGKGGGAELNDSLKMSLMALGKDFYLQRLMMASVVKKQRWQRRRKLCEEELAAVSLLALSCSSVYS